MTKLGSTTRLQIEAGNNPAGEGGAPRVPSGELVFCVCTNRRRTSLAMAYVFLLAAAVAFWSRAGLDVVMELAALAILACACMMWVRRTELRVSGDGLLAVGDLGGYRGGSLRLPWDRVRELHYGPGGGEEIGGLYALERSWCSRCVLPRVNEEQAAEVIATIAQHYPAMLPMGTPRSTHVAVSWPTTGSHAGVVNRATGAVDVR